VVAARQEAVAQRGEHARLVAAEVVGEDQVQRRAGLRLVLIVPVRAYRRYAQGRRPLDCAKPFLKPLGEVGAEERPV
jgi:hypothetical protein